MHTTAGRMRDSHIMSTGACARAAICSMSAALNGTDMSRFRTRPAPGIAVKRAGSTKARLATASGKRSMPPSRERRSAISLSADATHSNMMRQSCTICSMKRRLSRRLSRSALDRLLTADRWKDWLSILYDTSFLAHMRPCDSTLQIIVSPSRKSIGFLEAAVPYRHQSNGPQLEHHPPPE